MKKSLSLFLAAAMTMAALAGCAAPTGKSTTAAETATTKTAAEAASLETAATTAADTAATTATEAAKAPQKGVLRVGSLKGPTSMGLVSLMDKSKKGETAGSYEFTMVTAADELLAKMAANELDIALLPANVASILYNKTHGINVIDINTLGVLYLVSSDDSMKTMGDLKGKTIYLTGKGTSPDYVLNYLLTANGLNAGDVTLEYKSEPTEVAALLKEQPGAIGLLPQPFVTVAMAQNETLKIMFDLTKEWENIQGADGGSLVTGVTVARGELFEEREEEVRIFMTEHMASSQYATAHVEETAQLVADAGIIEKAAVAAKSIPYCSITYIDGEKMKTMLNGYLQVLFEQDQKTIGGALPGTDFYYIP